MQRYLVQYQVDLDDELPYLALWYQLFYKVCIIREQHVCLQGLFTVLWVGVTLSI